MRSVSMRQPNRESHGGHEVSAKESLKVSMDGSKEDMQARENVGSLKALLLVFIAGSTLGIMIPLQNSLKCPV